MEILISAVQNGYMVRPPVSQGMCIANYDILVFEKFDHLVDWMRERDEEIRAYRDKPATKDPKNYNINYQGGKAG